MHICIRYSDYVKYLIKTCIAFLFKHDNRYAVEDVIYVVDSDLLYSL